MGDGAGLKDWVLAIAGNIFIVFLVIRVIGAYVRNAWDEMFGAGLGAIVVAALVYSNDSVIEALKKAVEWIFP